MIHEGLRVAVQLKDKTVLSLLTYNSYGKVPVFLVRTNSAHYAARRLNSSAPHSMMCAHPLSTNRRRVTGISSLECRKSLTRGGGGPPRSSFM